MKHLKELKTGNLLKTTNEAAAEKVKNGGFAFIKKGKFKRFFKEDQKQKSRFKKRNPPVFCSGQFKKAQDFISTKCTTKKDANGEDLLNKNGEKQFKKLTSHKRNEQKQAEARNKKRRRK